MAGIGRVSRRSFQTMVDRSGNAVPLKLWTEGVPKLEAVAEQQLKRTANLNVIHKTGIAVMPDCHWGMGATVGSVIPTKAAIIPAAVGVDIGCGMIATKTSLSAAQLPDSLKSIRFEVENHIPHGRTDNGQRSSDKGSWVNGTPVAIQKRFRNELFSGYRAIAEAHPKIAKGNLENHLGTLGTGNHFVEMCLDEQDCVWLMLHSGSRGIGNRIGMYFIELAKKDLGRRLGSLPDKELAYFSEGSKHFNDYFFAVRWAQDFARINREIMMENFVRALRKSLPEGLREFSADTLAVNCHHNYVNLEFHFGEELLITRKGALSAEKGQYGIIPGSMGAKSFIVRGKGNRDSYCSCSHGAGRLMSRAEAKRRFTLAQHREATKLVECRKDEGVLDETPMAYKPIDAVMKAQEDLVEIIHTLRQVMCVKG